MAQGGRSDSCYHRLLSQLLSHPCFAAAALPRPRHPVRLFLLQAPRQADRRSTKVPPRFLLEGVARSRYSQSLETRVAQDIVKIEQILKRKLPTYDWAVDVSPLFIENNVYFSASRSFVKAILCVLAHKEPKSFIDNSIVRLDNAYLKQANSRNYHHFFPKSWLEKHGFDWAHINHMANITLVDDFLDKRIIRAQSPKTYMKEFIKHNPEIDKCLSTHLIKLNEAFGVMSDDYDKFFAARCKAISRELAKQIIPQEIDQVGSATTADETVVEEEEWLAS